MKINLNAKLVIERYEELKSLRDTALSFNCSVRPIIRVLKENSIERPKENYKTKEKQEKHRTRMLGNKLGEGYRHSKEFRIKLSNMRRGKGNPQYDNRGENCPNWKGNDTTTYIGTLIRQSAVYQEWRKKVFERDNYTCKVCKKIGGQLHAHHIKSFAKHPESRFDINNGETLCINCHKNTDSFLNNRCT